VENSSSKRSNFLGAGQPILRVAGVILLACLIGTTTAVVRWVGNGFGPIVYNDVMLMLVIQLTAVAVAVQIAAAGFLASILNSRR
jgi:hypothetical protein